MSGIEVDYSMLPSPDVYQALLALTGFNDGNRTHGQPVVSKKETAEPPLKKSRIMSNLLTVSPGKYYMNPTVRKTEFMFSSEFMNQSSDEIRIEFWQSGISGVYQLVPGNDVIKPFEIKSYDFHFFFEDELNGESLEAQLVLQEKEESKLVKIHVIVQKKGMMLHMDYFERPENFTLEIYLKDKNQVHRIFGYIDTNFLAWKEKLCCKLKNVSPRNTKLLWKGAALDDTATPLMLGMEDMCKIDAEKVY